MTALANLFQITIVDVTVSRTRLSRDLAGLSGVIARGAG